MKSRLLTGLSAVILALFSIARANAQVDLSPGVARISLIHGEVSTQRGDSGDWAAAALNAPVTSGDKISTGDRSRGEVQLDYANILRLSERTQADIASLTRTKIQIQIGRGLADYTVLKGTEADVEIDTPNLAIRPGLREGIFRIEVNSEGETRVIVRKGEAEISTPQGSTRIEKGQLVIVQGSGDGTQYKIAEAPSKDSWDSWNSDRDHLIRDAQSWNHTNRYYVGAEDLDAYGRWVTVPEYGSVWAPAVHAGWAPYRSGRWVWQPYWGWTWVSYEPWGWAPYHYGRWFLYDSSWVWWPGPVVAYPIYRPVWAPAYVSFFGFGRGFGVSFGFGSVGWLPIGPCDPFFPWYGRHRNHFNVVNVTNITNITNVYNIHNGRRFDGIAPLRAGNRHSNLRLAAGDERVRQAISTVPSDRFGTGRAAATPVSRELFRQGQVMTGNLPVVPARESLSASNRPASPSTLPRGGQQERFFMKSRPAAAPQPFERQAEQMQQAIQRDGRFKPISAGSPLGSPNAAKGPAAPAGTRGPGSERQAAPAPRPQATRPTQTGRAGSEANVPSFGANSAKGAKPGPRTDNWRRFGPDRAQNQPQGSGRGSSEVNPSEQQPIVEKQPRNTSPAARDGAGWRRFGSSNSGQSADRPGPSRLPPDSQSSRSSGVAEGQPSAPATRMNPPSRPAESSPAPDRNPGWHRFTPQPQSAQPEPAGRRDGANDQGDRFPARNETRGMESSPRENRAPVDRGSARDSRPSLDLRQPIVTPRVSRETPRPDRGPGNQGGGSRMEPNRGGGNRAEPNRNGGNRDGSGNGGRPPHSSSGDRHRN